MDDKRTMARNIFAKQFDLPRTTANVLVERWSDEDVANVLSKPIGEVNSVLAGITPQEFVPQSIQEEVASRKQAVAKPPRIVEDELPKHLEPKPSPADQM